MSILTPSIAGWQAGFLHVLPAVKNRASHRFRSLPARHREEAIQESIASAWVGYRALAVQGRLDQAYASTIANYAVKQAAGGRHVGGRHDTAGDAMSPASLRRRGGTLERYDDGDYESDQDAWKNLVIPSRKTDIPGLACFRIDFAAWLRLLRDRDRRIIAALVGGAGTAAVASRFHLTPGRVSQLRRKYEHLWRTFQGDAAHQPAA